MKLDMVCPGLNDVNLTEVLNAVSDGDPDAMNQLLEAVYADLHRMCLHRLNDQRNSRCNRPSLCMRCTCV